MDETPATRPIDAAGDALHVRRVFGEAYQAGDTLVIPVARVVGGSGMGYGTGALGSPEQGGTGEGSGGGGGFGVHAKAVGVYTVRDGVVRWQPALDLNRVILGGQVVGAIAVLALARALRARRR
ncbi:hypothetical protein M3148_04735 [Georgenia satyanarayanai]|uniref:spore germination protein GerW family protein n=1 Tax=Georgenia satyanarayanai TaxID=860221 RepID=UPI00204221F3|nr:spore germination protein GerW family protein [Georgenia satyanarayanai]MCM3660304.1 hypothetical protein [Georgenia satyanarayanai]